MKRRTEQPTEDYAEICTRVRSLLEVGTSFHPELTERESMGLGNMFPVMEE